MCFVRSSICLEREDDIASLCPEELFFPHGLLPFSSCWLPIYFYTMHKQTFTYTQYDTQVLLKGLSTYLPRLIDQSKSNSSQCTSIRRTSSDLVIIIIRTKTGEMTQSLYQHLSQSINLTTYLPTSRRPPIRSTSFLAIGRPVSPVPGLIFDDE